MMDKDLTRQKRNRERLREIFEKDANPKTRVKYEKAKTKKKRKDQKEGREHQKGRS